MVFSFSKIIWLFLKPGNLLVIGLLGGYLLRFAPWRRLRRLGSLVLALSLGAVLAIAVLPIGTWLIAPLESRFSMPAAWPEQVDGIVVLGGSISLHRSAGRGTAQLNEYAERLITFADLARRYPKARLAFVGGSGSLLDQVNRESDFVPGLMTELGIDPGRILFERESRNSYENAVYSKRLIEPRPGEVWLLVTSAFHMPRAVGVFRAAGWAVVPVPVDYQTSGPGAGGPGFDFAGGLRLVSLGLHEWAGLIAYRIFGWTDSLYPAPKPGP